MKVKFHTKRHWALTACSGESGETKKLGFASVDEMKEIHAQGWHTKERYEEDIAKKLGYSSAAEWKAAELKIKKEKEFEENWKANGRHFMVITCVSPGHHLAEQAMLGFIQGGQNEIDRLMKIGAFYMFCASMSEGSGGGGKWVFGDNIKVIAMGKAIYWTAETTSKEDPNSRAVIGGYTK